MAPFCLPNSMPTPVGIQALPLASGQMERTSILYHGGEPMMVVLEP